MQCLETHYFHWEHVPFGLVAILFWDPTAGAERRSRMMSRVDELWATVKASGEQEEEETRKESVARNATHLSLKPSILILPTKLCFPLREKRVKYMFSFSHPVHENNALHPSQSKILLAAEPAAEPPTPSCLSSSQGCFFKYAFSASAASACSLFQSKV